MNKLYLYLTTSLSLFNLITQTTPAIAQNTEIQSQINSVTQLSDIQPNDWAYQALQSLVERYSVIIGYPDSTFKGNRAMTRYEFAAGLNAALNKINQLMQTALADKVSKEDLLTLNRLREEFVTELTALRGRVDTLETKAAELEANQFSTTTKLSGQAIFAINGGTQSGTNNPNTTFFSRTRINLETSFTGKDTLLTQFQAGTGNNGDATQFLQTETGDFKNRLVNAGEKLTQQKFEQLFFPLNTLGVSLDDLGLGLAKLNTVDEVRDTLTGNIATLDLEAGISQAEALQIQQNLNNTINNARIVNNFLQLNSKLDYSGADTSFKLNRLSYTFPVSEDFRISIFPQGYASDYVDRNSFANNSANNFSTYGLVNNQLLLAQDTPGAGAAISWNPGKGAFTIRGVYRAEQAAFANSNNTGGLFGGSNLGVAEIEYAPSKTVALRLQYSGGTQLEKEYSAVGANLEVALSEKVGIFGRFGHAFNFPGNIRPSSWSAGFVFKDLFTKGALAGVSVGQPLIFQDKDDVFGLFNSTQTNYEAFYKLPVNDNISISPVLQVISNPGNAQANTILTGTLRTVFSF